MRAQLEKEEEFETWISAKKDLVVLLTRIRYGYRCREGLPTAALVSRDLIHDIRCRGGADASILRKLWPMPEGGDKTVIMVPR